MVFWEKKLPLHRFLKKEVGFGTLAQLVEHRTENPGVPGSIPGGTTKSKADSIIRVGFFIFYHLKQLIFSILDIIVEYVSSCLGFLVKSLK